MKKLLLSLFILSSLFALNKEYTKGYRLYIRYVKHIPKYGIKAPTLLKKLHIQSEDEITYLIKTKKIVKEIEKFNPKAAKGIEKILKKDPKGLEVFLKSVFNGEIPPGCN